MMHHAAPALAAVAFLGRLSSFGQAEVTRPVVSEDACPAKVIEAPTRDGQKATAVVRKPTGRGPFPAVVFLHGGLNRRNVDRVKREAPDLPTNSRFLAAGYVTVEAVFRGRSEDPQSKGALTDCLAILERLKAMPEVDSKCVVVLGHSGGGSRAGAGR
jgi:dipeptidyl aminopeptidase/acylaminoacyl peptidase